MQTKTHRALVLPGGGFRGAYQAGVVYELGRLGVTFDIVVGASVGACNGAAFTLNMWDTLPQLWEQAVTRKIFQPSSIFKGKNPFSISRVLKEFSTEYGKQGQFDEISTDFLISVTNASEMKNEIIHFKDKNWTYDELADLYLASSSIPFICEKIMVRGKWYVDGGFTNNCPIDVAIERGANEIWVVNMGEYHPLEQNFFRIVRGSLKVWPGPKFQTLKLLESLVSVKAEIMPTHVKIHQITPSKPLKIGHLHLTKEKVQQTIRHGIEDVQHFLSQKNQ